VLLLADDVALEVHAHFDGLAALGGCAAPDASAVLLEPGNIGEAACLNPGFGLTLSEAVGSGNRGGGIVHALSINGTVIKPIRLPVDFARTPDLP